MPLDIEDPSEDAQFPDNVELAEVKEEEAIAIKKSIGIASSHNFDVEPDFQEVVKVMVTDNEQQGN